MRELLRLWFPPAETDALCPHLKEGRCYALITPYRFIGIGMMPTRDASLAGRRIEEIRSIGVRHMTGITLGEGIDAARERAGLMLMIYPLHPPGIRLGSIGWAAVRNLLPFWHFHRRRPSPRGR